MSYTALTRRHVLHGVSGVAFSVSSPLVAWAATPVQLISHRYPALEFWANKMKTAVPGVDVNTQLMPFDKMMELVSIAMSSKAETFDIVYAIDSSVATYAKNGWLRPLDDLWAKYNDEFK